MWARRIRPGAGRQLRLKQRPPGLNRHYNDQPKTYFQDSPPPKPTRGRRIFSSVLWTATTFALGAYSYHLAYKWAINTPLDFEDVSEEQALEMAQDVMVAGTQDMAAREAPPMTVEAATELLETRSGYAVTPTTVAHTSQLPSNLPCEDTWSCGAYTFNGDQAKDWDEW